MRHPVSRRYARAFLDIGVERGNHKLLQKQLDELAHVYAGSPDLRAIIANPSVKISERRSIIRKIAQKLGWDEMMTNLSLLLIDNARLKYIDDICSVLGAMVDVHEGNIRAAVTTSRPLPDLQVQGIKKAIETMTGKNVLMETSVDPTLLGGVVTRIGGTVYDGSVQTQLETLRGSILEEV